MIPTYDPDPDYLEQAIAGILAQDPGEAEMQIQIVDDASSSFDPEEFLIQKRISRVSFFRKTTREGIGGNWNRCLELSQGRWIHLLHQDDLVLPGFYTQLRHGLERDQAIGAAFCQQFLIDANGDRGRLLSHVRQDTPGIIADWIEHIFVRLSVQTPSIVVKRSVYEHLGGFDPTFEYALDWDMWKRIAARYRVWYEPRPLACYRKHQRAATSALVRSGKNMKENARSIDVAKSYLPPAEAESMSRRAREYGTWSAVHTAGQLLFFDRDVLSTVAQLREARKLTSSATVIRKMFELGRRTLRDRVNRNAAKPVRVGLN